MCEFIENNTKCCKKNIYGNYCKKHKRNHLIYNEIISIHNFTNKSSDYLKKNIVIFDITNKSFDIYLHNYSNSKNRFICNGSNDMRACFFEFNDTETLNINVVDPLLESNARIFIL